MLPALSNKQIDGYSTSLPFSTEAEVKGLGIVLVSGPRNDMPEFTPFDYVVLAGKAETCQKNREKCMKLLRARLYEAAREAQEKKISSNRKSQVGSGDRSEKIRTYNFSQDRITDHRIGFSLHNIPEVLDGKISPLIQALRSREEEEKLK